VKRNVKPKVKLEGVGETAAVKLEHDSVKPAVDDAEVKVKTENEIPAGTTKDNSNKDESTTTTEVNEDTKEENITNELTEAADADSVDIL
jgi:hypothetical protein